MLTAWKPPPLASCCQPVSSRLVALPAVLMESASGLRLNVHAVTIIGRPEASLTLFRCVLFHDIQHP